MPAPKKDANKGAGNKKDGDATATGAAANTKNARDNTAGSKDAGSKDQQAVTTDGGKSVAAAAASAAPAPLRQALDRCVNDALDAVAKEGQQYQHESELYFAVRGNFNGLVLGRKNKVEDKERAAVESALRMGVRKLFQAQGARVATGGGGAGSSSSSSSAGSGSSSNSAGSGSSSSTTVDDSGATLHSQDDMRANVDAMVGAYGEKTRDATAQAQTRETRVVRTAFEGTLPFARTMFGGRTTVLPDGRVQVWMKGVAIGRPLPPGSKPETMRTQELEDKLGVSADRFLSFVLSEEAIRTLAVACSSPDKLSGAVNFWCMAHTDAECGRKMEERGYRERILALIDKLRGHDAWAWVYTRITGDSAAGAAVAVTGALPSEIEPYAVLKELAAHAYAIHRAEAGKYESTVKGAMRTLEAVVHGAKMLRIADERAGIAMINRGTGSKSANEADESADVADDAASSSQDHQHQSKQQQRQQHQQGEKKKRSRGRRGGGGNNGGNHEQSVLGGLVGQILGGLMQGRQASDQSGLLALLPPPNNRGGGSRGGTNANGAGRGGGGQQFGGRGVAYGNAQRRA